MEKQINIKIIGNEYSICNLYKDEIQSFQTRKKMFKYIEVELQKMRQENARG